MTARRARLAIVVGAASLAWIAQAQQPPTLPKPPTYDELKQLIAASTLKYQLVADKDVPPVETKAGQVLPPFLRIADDGQGRRHIDMMKAPSENVQKAFAHCEEIFAQSDFKAAAACFEEVRKLDATFTPALTNMGDALYQAKDFERA
jgi:hypothetical protein